MDTTYSKAVALAVPVFLALIALEFTVDRVKRTRYYQDRKSTRLNSSHLVISYAVFCLKNNSGKDAMSLAVWSLNDITVSTLSRTTRSLTWRATRNLDAPGQSGYLARLFFFFF